MKSEQSEDNKLNQDKIVDQINLDNWDLALKQLTYNNNTEGTN